MQIQKDILFSLTIQFENGIQPIQWGAPVVLLKMSLILGEDGKALYQPATVQRPAASSDIDDAVLAQINRQLAAVGLVASRAGAVNAAPAGE